MPSSGYRRTCSRWKKARSHAALQRMLIKGWVTAEWGVAAENRRARYYWLTAAGRKQLEAEISQFRRVMGAITRVIQTE